MQHFEFEQIHSSELIERLGNTETGTLQRENSPLLGLKSLDVAITTPENTNWQFEWEPETERGTSFILNKNDIGNPEGIGWGVPFSFRYFPHLLHQITDQHKLSHIKTIIEYADGQPELYEYLGDLGIKDSVDIYELIRIPKFLCNIGTNFEEWRILKDRGIDWGNINSGWGIYTETVETIRTSLADKFIQILKNVPKGQDLHMGLSIESSEIQVHTQLQRRYARGGVSTSPEYQLEPVLDFFCARGITLNFFTNHELLETIPLADEEWVAKRKM